MALNMDAAGKETEQIIKDYTWKDVVLYALGVGAGFSDIEYCYEKKLKVIPSFSVFTLFDFMAHAVLSCEANLSGVLHVGQELIFHNQIPTEGRLTTTGSVIDFYDKGKEKGALIKAQSETSHSNGKKLFTATADILSRLDGGFNGKKINLIKTDFPQKDPDFSVLDKPSENQPLLYRLSGDIFPLHADPEFAKMCGFEKPIMHGLCTLGYSCRALIKSLVPGMPEKVSRIKCRFSGSLYPGVPVKTLIWNTADGKALWQTINCETSKAVIDDGEFEYIL